MPFCYDAEYYLKIEPFLPVLASAPELQVGDVAQQRSTFEATVTAMYGSLPTPTGVEQSVFHVKAADGFDVPIYRFAKTDVAASSTALLPAIVYIHGGGYVCCKVDNYTKLLGHQVSDTGVQIFAIDYRVAPEAPFPIPIEDCYAGLQWVHDHVAEFGVDPARIAVMGDSAGGGLAAATAILARDRALSPPLAKQILIYPMLDDRNNVPIASMEPFLTWKYSNNLIGWTAYVGDKAGKDGVSPYAAPARVESMTGLPPTYIDVGELDIFRDENIAYATRLLAADISTELHVYPGVPHGFDGIAPTISVSGRAYQNRHRAISSI